MQEGIYLSLQIQYCVVLNPFKYLRLLMPRQRLHFLLALYLDQTISESEQYELSQLVANHPQDKDLIKLLEQAWEELNEDERMPDIESERIISAILNPASLQNFPKVDNKIVSINRKVIWLKRLSVAASVLLIISISYFSLRPAVSNISNDKNIEIAKDFDIKPGGQKAILTLSDGSHIILDSSVNGLLANQGATKVIKLANGQLLYSSSKIASAEVIYNTMSTPIGGQYQLQLPDGSKVWLNAASSIRFPTAFSEKVRRVEITGEAYFEIAKNENMPFVVQFNNGTEVKVLGTHFNIKAYSDEPEIKTTLLEGSISIKHGQKNTLLSPGNQAQIDKKGDIKLVMNSNTEEALAWKNGIFQFNSTDLESVVSQMARWYDIEVEYKGIPSKENRFTGKIPMSVNLSRLLKWMEWSDVHFKLKGNKLTVIP